MPNGVRNVPAIFDYLQPDGYFKTHEAEITALNHKIKEAEALLPKGKRTREVEAMKQERKERSQALQRWLFSQFVITPPPTPQKGNKAEGESILKVFTDYAQRTGSEQVQNKLCHQAEQANVALPNCLIMPTSMV